MAITILDIVKAVHGDDAECTGPGFWGSNTDEVGRCDFCSAAITADKIYPSKFGHLCCANCIGSDGYTTVTEYQGSDHSMNVHCPRCHADETSIRETHDKNEGVRALECGNCGYVIGQWQDHADI